MPYSSVQKDFYLFTVSSVYYVQFRDPETRELLSKKSTGFRNGTMAEKWAKQEFARLTSKIGKTDLLFREYAERFYVDGCPHEKERKANNQTFGIKTRMDNRYKLKAYIFPDPICKKRLCDISRPDVLDFRDRLIDKLGYTRKAQLTLICFKNIIHAALDRGLINSDPTVKVNIKLANKGRRAAASIDGVKRILLRK